MKASILKNILKTTGIAVCALSMSAQAYADSYFGFAPLDPDFEMTSALGAGKNGYAEAAIALDPVNNPVVAALKGAKIIGFRCYMRADYRQKNKKTSAINVRTGSLGSDPVKNYADFYEGWNDIMLDSPVEIGDEAIYIGPMVYETGGTPYPFMAVKGPGFAEGFNVSLNKEPWQTFTQRGNLLMQVILDRDPEEMPLAASVALADIPLVVAPESSFTCSMAVHNFSGQPIESVTVKSTTDDGETDLYRTIELKSPVLPFDTDVVEVELETGFTEDNAVGYDVEISEINGQEADASPAVAYSLHVTLDAFLRIPLVEEFTSQLCTNCPFMMYYIDRAMEEFGKPHVYITRHAGFAKDAFTIGEDEELTYMFGKGATYNPAVMYDRTIFEENATTPVVGASEASTQPYLEALTTAAMQPALAKILVDSSSEGETVSCLVKGKIARGVDIENLYLCAYLIENDIPYDKYFQLGIEDAPDDAPEDLAETFRHNGIIRVQFHKSNLGDKLTVDPETREFCVDYGAAGIKSDWVAGNCEIVAFVCNVNKNNVAENKVLNAGGTRWNEKVENGGSSVGGIEAEEHSPIVCVGPDRMLRVIGDCAGYDVYTVAGRKMSAAAPLADGIYVVSVSLHNGKKIAVKVAVR